METRSKSNAEFRNDVNEVLAQHESRFDQIHLTLQQVLTELQGLRVAPNPTHSPREVNPFSNRETGSAHNRHLKLSFPRFDGNDPVAWIYKAEQYFDFNVVPTEQEVQLASFHLEGIAL